MLGLDAGKKTRAPLHRSRLQEINLRESASSSGRALFIVFPADFLLVALELLFVLPGHPLP